MSARPTNESSIQQHSWSGMLYRIWHFPDHWHWMAPLPVPHRRWIIILSVILIILFLLPTPKETVIQPIKVLKPAPSQQAPQGPLVIDGGDQSFADLTTTPVRIINGQPQTENDDQGTWKTLQVQQGQTFSQLLKDNNFPVEDALALARVEGDSKPLTNLKVGQKIKLKLDKQGRIIAVELDISPQQHVFFIRQANGGFYRY